MIVWGGFNYDGAEHFLNTGGRLSPPEAENRAPIGDPGGPYEGDEGESLMLDGSGSSDPDEGDAIALYEWDFDYDGETFDVDAAEEAATVTHAYPDDGDFVVALRVTDTHNAKSEPATTEVVVTNVVPEVSPPAGENVVMEGAAADVDLGEFTDPGDDGPWLISVEWGDGTEPTTFEATAPGPLGTQVHGYDDGPAEYAVTVLVTEKEGAASDPPGTVPVRVENVAPSAELVVPVESVPEGSSFAIGLANPTDPSQADSAAGFSYAFDCGTGYGPPSTDPASTCPALDDPSATVKGKIIDKDGGGQEYDEPVTVTNVAPELGTLTLLPGTEVKVGEVVSLSLDFADAGVLDTHSALITWGDGTTSAATITESNGAGVATGSHQYARGTYTIAVTVDDGDGGTASSSATIIVTGAAPKLKLTPADGPAGSVVQVGGSNFTPGSTVQITWDSGAVLGSGAVGPDGTFTLTISVPSDASTGVHIISAADTGGAVAKKDFNVRKR